MGDLYVYNPHAPAQHNVDARSAAVARGERPAWDPAVTDDTPPPTPVSTVAMKEQPHGQAFTTGQK